MSISFSISERRFNAKPSTQETQLLQFQAVCQPIENLITCIEHGQTFTCATYLDNHRHSESFLSQQLLAVDFDNTLTLTDATGKLDDYGLTFNFGYYTFSHTDEKPRFRLVFVMDGEVRDKQLVWDINDALHRFFDKKTDKSCNDAARLWYGSTRKSFLGVLNQRINLKRFLEKVNQKIYSVDHHLTRNCINVNNIELDFCSKTRCPIITYNRDSDFSTKKGNYSTPNEKTPPLIEKWNIEVLLQYELFRRFYEGGASGKENKLSHDELFGLATNLAPLEGGRKLFKELLDKNPNYHKEKYSIIGYVVKEGYRPQHFKEFSPFSSNSNHPHQTFSQALRKRGQITVLEQPQLMTLHEAERKRDEAFRRVLAAQDAKVYLMVIAPGLGKTEIVKNLPNVVVAFPDHLLKEEQFQSSKFTSEHKVSTPDLKGRFSSAVTERFEALFAMDLALNVRMELSRLAGGEIVAPGQKDTDVAAAKVYLDELDDVHQAMATKTVFTTHKRAIQYSWVHDTIIYDEDPCNVILETHTAKVSEMELLLGRLLMKGIHVPELTELLNQPDFATPKATPAFSIGKQLVHDICAERQFKSHVVNFFNSESYFIHNGYLHYCVNNKEKFHKEKKYIICDATASIETYQRLFGDRLEVVDISHVENRGTLHQYTSRSYSKMRFEEYETDTALNTTIPTITYKDFKRHFTNATEELHFGRVRGSNVYSGRDLNVVGTFHFNDAHYKFLSYSLKIPNNEWEMEYQRVRYKGREFMFMTFTNPTLQKIHLEMVEGELVQAVHRARLLRYDCSVHLYSNFPLEQAHYHY